MAHPDARLPLAPVRLATLGSRSEKLVEFGLQPFRSRPRVVQLVGPDGKPLKRPAGSAEEPAPLA